MSIVDDYEGIAAELRRIREAEGSARAKTGPKSGIMIYVTPRGMTQIEIPLQGRPRGVLARRGWITD